MLIHALIYLVSFMAIWLGSGLVVRSVEKLARSLKISSFAVSFIVLGFFTSISELSVGVNSVLENDPELFVGNLIGASVVLLLLVVPLLAILGNSIHISQEFQGLNLPISLLVIAMPVLLAIDGEVSRIDGIVAIFLYILLLTRVQVRQSLLEKWKTLGSEKMSKHGQQLLHILIGIALIFVASKYVVAQTVYFSGLLNISPFVISLLFIAIGTNVPELSLAFRSAFMRNNQVAFGDYVGSAAFNTFLLGLLTLFYGKTVVLTNNYLSSLLFLVVGLVLFYYFARSKNTISRTEGLVLLLLYGAFLYIELRLAAA